MSNLIRVLILALVGCTAETTEQPAAENRNIRFGMPKHDGKLFKDVKHEDHIITREQYVLSYNGRFNTPNWVSWRLVASDVGSTARGAFEPDPDLPKGF